MKRILYFIFTVTLFFSFIAISINNTASAQGLGDLGKPGDYYLMIKRFRPAFYGPYTAGLGNEFPPSFDWRNEGVVTPAGDQGFCGSCWAFAAVGVLESKILMVGGPEYDLSEQQLISCMTEAFGCCGGNSNALRFFETRGPMLEGCTDYLDSGSRCPIIRSSSCSDLNTCPTLPYYRTTNYYTVDTTDIDEIKSSIYYDGPAYFSFKVYSDFKKKYSWQTTFSYWDDAGYGDVYTQTSGYRRGGHAVLIIGWDDAKGAWLCKNSWGATDGPNGDGTFLMAYIDHNQNLEFGMANIELSRYTQVTLENRDSFDFSTNTIGYILGGDLYYYGGKFWANNVGQRGVIDLGYIGTTLLDEVNIPTRGYTRFGVSAITGHTYVALAGQGEEGNYIAFRVTSKSADNTKVGIVYFYHSNRVDLYNRDSYDFSDRVRGTLSGGDFYLSGSKFWANNSGQRGIKDLGNIGSFPPSQISIPTTGYTRFGVPVLKGHTYVSKAQQGEEGNHIIFYVRDITFRIVWDSVYYTFRLEYDKVTIDFLYIRP